MVEVQDAISYYIAISQAMQAHSSVITAIFESDVPQVGIDSQGVSDRLLMADRSHAELLRLSAMIRDGSDGSECSEPA